LGPYYKSKVELKSNSSEILPVNCKFICDSMLQLKLTKLMLKVLKSDFSTKKKLYIYSVKLAINWQIFSQVRLQLKFAFIIWPLD